MFPFMSQAFPAMATMAAMTAPVMQGFISPFNNPWGWGQLAQAMQQRMPMYQSYAPAPMSLPFRPQSLQQAASGVGAVTSPEELRPLFAAAAERHNLPQNFLEAVAHQESRFRPDARSRVGAQGIMQLMPATAKELGVTDVLDPAQNIDGGARYLRQMLDMFGGDYSLALAAYNAGPGRVRRAGGIPQLPETQNYVQSIMGRLGQ